MALPLCIIAAGGFIVAGGGFIVAVRGVYCFLKRKSMSSLLIYESAEKKCNPNATGILSQQLVGRKFARLLWDKELPLVTDLQISLKNTIPKTGKTSIALMILNMITLKLAILFVQFESVGRGR